MKCSLAKYLCLYYLVASQTVSAISIVYNFRIAQITKQTISNETRDNPAMLTALFFDLYQKKYTGDISQNFIGGLGSYIYNFESSDYLRLDFAFSNIHEKAHQVTTFSGTEFDDILLTIGHNFQPTQQSKITLSGLFGIPTHPILDLEHVSFGYGQVGAGIQLDGSYQFKNNPTYFLWGTRYLGFIPRCAKTADENSYKFSIGNVGDLLVALKNNWNHHGLEAGYTARFNFGASVYPKYDDIVAKTNYTRNNFYVVYKYKFQKNNFLHRFLINAAYGFDSKPKQYGNKYIIMIWTSWSISF